jgi:hypothetical protein
MNRSETMNHSMKRNNIRCRISTGHRARNSNPSRNLHRCRTLLICLAALLIIVQSCEYPPRLNFDRGLIPNLPQNINEVNSVWDDYNSMPIETGVRRQFSLIFSTNRMSQGGNYDLVSFPCEYYRDLKNWHFEFRANTEAHGGIHDYDYNYGGYLPGSLDEVNTEFNELGPYAHYTSLSETRNNAENQKSGTAAIETHNRFFYANDSRGKLDIYCFFRHEYHSEHFILEGRSELASINSSSNDAYPAIHTDQDGRETLYFTSDREGDYDIFSAVPEDRDLVDQAEVVTVTRVEPLSTSSNDKCPFISGTTMLFASDRQGGYGGFDLYRSEFSGGRWTEPVNLGSTINTRYDEYRPVLIRMNEEEFISDLMIFSSNRPVGLGGFDLYYAGIPR